jgi:antitoxin component of MazEF toxin-antitoxin module
MPHVEERTISRVGAGSLMVTLPKSWLRFHRLGPGDKLVLISNGELILRPKRRRKNRLKKNSVLGHEEAKSAKED